MPEQIPDRLHSEGLGERVGSPIPQLALKRGFKGGHGAIVPSEGGWISLLGAWGGNLPHLAVLEFHRT